ncbi:MAG: DUF2189 domain-containing protein [Sphingomonadales bacterium]|nr:MAG: DUF2189 domain-containing protein [Sphingomonadales bacterium]
MTTIPPVVPALPRENPYARDLPPGSVRAWLGAGWRDLVTNPVPSLLYGVLVFLLSVTIILGLALLQWDYILFPALAGFLVFAPVLAVGLYEKSRAIEQGEPATFARMAMPRAKTRGQILFMGALLSGLMLLWMRSAIIIFALFFGVRPFPGLDHVAGVLFATPTGWMILAVGSVVGGLFAAFTLAIAAFSIPMMLDQRVDAFTAMGTSWALVWNNLSTMVLWGATVLALFLLCVATGMLGLIVVFPWLGHATWHAYKSVRP